MTPLVALAPLVHPRLGIESMQSYLHRLGAIYGASIHQILRFLCESYEVSNLVNQPPHHAPITAIALSGYSASVASLVRRLHAATGLDDPAAMTILRIGPALTVNGAGVLTTIRRHCPQCSAEHAHSLLEEVYEPLLWSMGTINCCPIHKVPLQIVPFKCDRSSLQISPWQSKHKVTAWDSYEQWRSDETIALLAYCADRMAKAVLVGAPKLFLTEYMARRHMSLSDFVQLTGSPYGNLKRQVEGVLDVTLATIFGIGQRLAISPLGILADPKGAARMTSLFDIRDHARNVSSSIPKGLHRHHPSTLRKELHARLAELLALDAPLPPLKAICHEMNVSTGYARHHLKTETVGYLRRRHAESMALHTAQRVLARTEARRLIEQCGQGASIKREEKKLRVRTSLPKHLLLDELSRAVRRSRANSSSR